MTRLRSRAFGASLLFLILSLITYNQFMNWVETRPGVQLLDPLFAQFHARDFTWVIFGGVYGALLLALYENVKEVRQLSTLLLSYGILIWIRILMMSVAPFDPPAGSLLLRDPLVEFFGNNRVLTRDLFFSGHTASTFLFFLAARKTSFRVVLGVVSLTVAAAVLGQHTHYTLDVVAAPFFAYVAWLAANKVYAALSGSASKKPLTQPS